MADLVGTLTSLVGTEAVLSPAHLASELGDVLPQVIGGPSLPQAVVYPNSEAQLAAVMTCAHQHQWRVLPCGQGSKLSWGGLAQGIDLVISTARLTQIIDHAVGDMTLTAQAGVRLADLTPTLAAVNQCLALDPAYPQRATLGGLVATGDTGSLRQRYGGVRDQLIGLSLVRYDGQIAKAGGRVVKNVAGYDLMKLFTGSYGTLGIISQLTFRLFPVQEASTTVVIAGDLSPLKTLTAAVRRSALTPVALDLISPALAIHLRGPAVPTLAARFQSITPGVAEQVAQLRQMIPAELAVRTLTQSDDQAFWDAANHALFPPDCPDPNAVTAKVGLRPTALCDLLGELQTLAPTGLVSLHAQSGLGTVSLGSEVVTRDHLKTLRSLCEQADGYLTLLGAPAALKTSLEVWGYGGNALGLMKAVKNQFDPHHCLSPGRFVGGM